MQKPSWLIIFAWLFSQPLVAADKLPEPAPDLSPEQVVQLQLEAMQHNDNPLPNAGIATVFRFASPANRQMTGPLDRFTLMVNGAAYRDLLNHKAAQILEAQNSPSHRLVPVAVTTRLGTQVKYVFVLSKHAGEECAGCWMTDAVMPVDRAQDTEPQEI